MVRPEEVPKEVVEVKEAVKLQTPEVEVKLGVKLEFSLGVRSEPTPGTGVHVIPMGLLLVCV